VIHFEQWERDDIEVRLVLKGGGCENMNAQYSLPAELPHLGRADRTIDGVRKCILHAVWHAQGTGCAPGAMGVCIGGDRTSGLRRSEAAVVPQPASGDPAPCTSTLLAVQRSFTLGVSTGWTAYH